MTCLYSLLKLWLSCNGNEEIRVVVASALSSAESSLDNKIDQIDEVQVFIVTQLYNYHPYVHFLLTFIIIAAEFCISNFQVTDY